MQFTNKIVYFIFCRKTNSIQANEIYSIEYSFSKLAFMLELRYNYKWISKNYLDLKSTTNS